MLLIGYEDGVKCAEVSLDDMPTSELKVILEIWDDIGRTWAYELEVKPYNWPRFDEEEVKDGK